MRGRRVRLTLDVEHRRFRLPVQEFTVASSGPYTQRVTRRSHEGASATLVRLGMEVPLRREE